MKATKFGLVIFLVLKSVMASGQVKLVVVGLPESTPQDAAIYVAGDFNGWNPGDDEYLLVKNDQDLLEAIIPGQSIPFEYKFTRGSWQTAEGNADNEFRSNRSFSGSDGTTIEIEILGWEDAGTDTNSGTASENVQILDEAFFIPQLNRNRRIWLYLPPDYETSSKDYPVLYMHDGQNVFDAATSFVGEWKVDETLDFLASQGQMVPIVVAVDHGDANRINEYSPWFNETYGGGEGDKYLDFIVQTLKPYIDENYRTQSGRESTAIAGSSMGGLISFYAGIKYPEVFSKLGVFSPSFPIFDEAFNAVEDWNTEYDFKVYLKSGALESSIAKATRDMRDKMIDLSIPRAQINMSVVADGEHSEWFWAREFPEVYEWLFLEQDVVLGNSSNNVMTPKKLSVFPNPTNYRNIVIEMENTDQFFDLAVYDHRGTKVYSSNFKERTLISRDDLSVGTYFIEISNKQNHFIERIMISD